MNVNEINSNSNQPEQAEENLSTINDAVNSLNKALSVLEKMNYLETEMSLRNLKFPAEGIDFQKAIKRYEINLVSQALRQTNGHQAKAAKLLNIPNSTLNAIIKRNKIRY